MHQLALQVAVLLNRNNKFSLVAKAFGELLHMNVSSRSASQAMKSFLLLGCYGIPSNKFDINFCRSAAAPLGFLPRSIN